MNFKILKRSMQMSLNDVLRCAQDNHVIFESFLKANKILNNSGYQNIVVSVSGGADSDIMIDICEKVEAKVRYVFFNTGIEYQATLEHLDWLENKYGLNIERIMAPVPVPLGVKKYGQPFLSKFVSEAIGSLQRHGFEFRDDCEGDYPIGYLKWWNNEHCHEGFKSSQFDVNFNKNLKPFLMENPPTFQISKRCCDGAKKNASKCYIKENNIDLILLGIRKAEGGIRSTQYKSCFVTKSGIHQYMPIFWYTNKDKEAYEQIFNIQHSRCYTEYGLKRTGCCGCPYNKDFESDLEIIKQYEPKLYKAVNNIFHDSYEYTRLYNEYCKQHNTK